MYGLVQTPMKWSFNIDSTVPMARRCEAWQQSLQTKNPDIFPVYLTSRQYVGEYAGNMSLLVPYSSDSHILQTNYFSTFNIPRIYRFSYIREESYIIECTDNMSGSGATRYREYTGFFYMPRIYREQLAKIACH